MSNKPLTAAALAALLFVGSAGSAFAQQVQLTIKDGRVTLKAENATVRQILDEWTRVGQTRIVNADKAAGQPVTLTLVDVPEREALDTVMRQAAGYAVVERTSDVPNASMFDRILVMARVTPVTQTASGSNGASGASSATYTPPAEPAAPAEEQVAMAEEQPPQPAAPVVNPYAPGGGQGAPGAVGPNGAANGANANAAGGSTVNVNPPVKFDYTNPQAYFEQQRRAQQAAAQAAGQTGQPGQVNQPQQQFINPYPGSNVAPIAVGGSGGGTAQPQQPSNVPTFGSGTTNQPGAAPAPQPAQPPANQGGNFNPYNMSGYTPPANSGQAPPATPVEPDRSKYANPYVPTRTP
jgi:hypothetical protein